MLLEDVSGDYRRDDPTQVINIIFKRALKYQKFEK